MVAGHLQQKKGHWYIVLNLHDETGKRRSKWIATHLPVRGNKRRAEEMLLQARQQHTDLYHRTGPASLLFSDYMLQWLAGMESICLPITPQKKSICCWTSCVGIGCSCRLPCQCSTACAAARCWDFNGAALIWKTRSLPFSTPELLGQLTERTLLWGGMYSSGNPVIGSFPCRMRCIRCFRI